MVTSKLMAFIGVAFAASAGLQSAAQSEPFNRNHDPVFAARNHSWAAPDVQSDAQSLHRPPDLLLQIVMHNRRGDPEWFTRKSGVNPRDQGDQVTPSSTYVALHIDRLDGTDLLTVRQRLSSIGNLNVYAGAGLARAKYLNDDALAKPLPWRRARHALGAAAEVGARTQLGTHVSLDAAVRWMKLSDGVTLLQSDAGSMAADAVMFGVTVGYRFR
jgi:hypothetical protein